MNAPAEEPLIVSAPLESTVTIPDSYTEYRNNVLAEANAVIPFAYPNDDALTHAVASLGALATIEKQVTAEEDKHRKPVNAWLKMLRAIRDQCIDPVIAEKERIGKIIATYQAAEREAARLRDRAAQQVIADAARKAQEAARELEQAKTPDAILAAELKAESAELAQTQAQATLATPANTPKGLVTLVRYDFEIVNFTNCINYLGEFWKENKAEEALKFDRAGFIKALNSDKPTEKVEALIPADGCQSTSHFGKGIRVFLDTRVSARA